jgi:type VI secretion system protein ImpK
MAAPNEHEDETAFYLDPLPSSEPAPDVPAAAAVSFDEATPRLAEAFAPVFALIVQLRTGGPRGSAEVLRQRIGDLLASAESAAREAGVPASDVEDAAFALVAFLDEALLSSDWSEKQAWLARPLQLERYDRYDAGEAFFDRMNGLLDRTDRAEVLEVYLLCLQLGFKGQYQLHGRDELRRLTAQAHAALLKAPGFAPGPLAPDGLPHGPAATAGRRRIPSWAILAAALLLAVLGYVGASLVVGGQAGEAAERVEGWEGGGMEGDPSGAL